MACYNRVVVEAPAKVNLFLDITGAAKNGYHLLDTVMQAVDLCDVVVIGRTSVPGIRVTCTRPGIPEDSSNLAHKAAVALLAEVGLPPIGFHIHIDKSIPHGAGLGGGSADAAAVLVGLNRLLEAGLSPERLRELGLALGADLPFALLGGCALARGVGEQLTPLPGLPPCSLVIAKPAHSTGTAEAYSRYDSCKTIRHGSAKAMEASLASGALEAAAGEMFNIFEQVEANPAATAALKAAMAAHGALGAALSGSGSAVAGLFGSPAAAEECAAALTGLAEESFVAAPLTYGAKILYAR